MNVIHGGKSQDSTGAVPCEAPGRGYLAKTFHGKVARSNECAHAPAVNVGKGVRTRLGPTRVG